jgi:hypothetical protein
MEHRLNTFHLQDKRPWPRHVATIGTLGKNTKNIIADRNLVECVAMRTKTGVTLSLASHLMQDYTEQNHRPK